MAAFTNAVINTGVVLGGIVTASETPYGSVRIA